MDETQEVTGTSVVAGCDAAEVLELVETALDAVAHLVGIEVVGNWVFPRRVAGNDGFGPGFGDDPPQLIGIICLVSQHPTGLEPFEQGGRLGDIAPLARREDDAQGAAPAVGRQMDLGGQSASGTPQSLIPPF